MNGKKAKILKVAAVMMIIGIIAGSGYAIYTLYEERNQLQENLEKSERRAKLLQKKFAQEKSKARALMRSKQSLEGRVRAMQAEIDQAKADKDDIEQELAGMEATYAKKTKHLEKKVEKLFERIESVKASRDEVVARYKEKLAVIRENEEKIAQLAGDLQKIGFELKQTTRSLENCTENNERLCLITEELVDKYKQKGVVGSIMVTEPFTQLEKVKVEKLVQEYTDKIEKERIE